jgi:phospholipase/lecithinase/hemolysin
MYHAKSRAALLLLALLLAVLSPDRTSASFTSMYVFGDGVSATNEPVPDDPLYYGKRNCNGRVWVEVLWQWQGQAFDNAKNYSGYGNISDYVLAYMPGFSPSDPATSLFVVWCANADFVEFLNGTSSNWGGFINAAVERHRQIVVHLYNKGARAVVLPSAVDIMAVPYYNFTSIDKTFVRQQVQAFNAQLKSTLEALPGQLAAQYPANSRLVLHFPDTFTFFDQVLANPGAYGLYNPYPYNAVLYDLVDELGYDPPLWSEPASSRVFWDGFHPTAKFQMHLADFFKKTVFPPKVKSLTVSAGMVQMQLADVPLGRAGFVQGSATLQPPWQQDAAVYVPFTVGGDTTQTITFPASGPQRFYRAGFPVVWTWP